MTISDVIFLNGTSAAETAIQDQLSGNTGGTIYLTDGSRWPNNYAVPAASPPVQRRWIAKGSFDYGQWGAPGNWPVGPAQCWGSAPPGIGDGDQLWQYSGGSTVVTQAHQTNPNNTPILVLNYINDLDINQTHQNSVPLVVNTYVRHGTAQPSNGYGAQLNVFSSGNGGYNICDVPISTYCDQTGNNNGWGGVHFMADTSGLGTGRPTKKWGIETDLMGSGPEQAGYWYNPYTGGRNTDLAKMAHYNGGGSWKASHAYAVGAIIQNVPVVAANGQQVMWQQPVVDGSGNPTLAKTPQPELYNAVCTTAGTSGATMPVFTLGAGSQPSLNADGSELYITDGTAVWQLTVTMRAATADCYLATTDALSSYGRAFSTYATIDDCVFNAWTAQMNHPEGNGAALRCAPNQPIDLNAGMENWGPRQNTRTLMYNAVTQALEYTVNGKVMFSVGDDGTITGLGLP